MEKNTTNLAGIYGLYCGTCPNYLAYQEDDQVQLQKISQATGLPVEKIRCDGCLSDILMPHCIECRHGFRKCSAEKKVTWCFQCPEFPCQRLSNFKNVHIVDGISHHEHVIDELQYMKGHGIEEWAQKQDKAGRCPQCGKMLYWFARECPGCHTKIR